MKNLANCDPIEFFVQTNKIRKAVEKWLSLTKIMEIRKQLPPIKDGETKEERRKAFSEQIKKNAKDVLDSVMEDHPVETAQLLGLLCFVEPDDLRNHKMSEFFGAFTELIESPEVIDFFISLTHLGQRISSNTAKV